MFRILNIKSKKGLMTSIFLIVLILVIIGLITQLSISAPESLKNTQGASNSRIFINQGMMLVVSLLVFMTIIYVFPTTLSLKKISILLYPLGIIFLILPFIPGIGVTANGARRWFKIGSFQLQPSEIVKIFLIMILALIIEWGHKKFISKKQAYFCGLAITLIYVVLIYFSKSLSLTLQVLAIFFLMYAFYGYPLTWQLGLFSLMAFAGAMSIITTPYRIARLLGTKEQANYSIKTISNGGIFGTGYGNGIGRNFYLPEVQTDFVFAGFSEEWGIIGSIILLILFTILIFLIFYSTRFMKTVFEKICTTGIGVMLANQVIAHVLINLAIFPTTGVTLPFISQGGSSLLTIFMSLAVLTVMIFNIEEESFYKQK